MNKHQHFYFLITTSFIFFIYAISNIWAIPVEYSWSFYNGASTGESGGRIVRSGEVNKPKTLEARLAEIESKYFLPKGILYATCQRESGCDSSRKGDFKNGKYRSFGAFQVNITAHKNISLNQAQDFYWAAEWTAQRYQTKIKQGLKLGMTYKRALLWSIQSHLGIHKSSSPEAITRYKMVLKSTNL